MGATISMVSTPDHVREKFSPDVAEFLLSSDSFKLSTEPARRAMMNYWREEVFGKLVKGGWMRVTNSGRYAWNRYRIATTPQGPTRYGWFLYDTTKPSGEGCVASGSYSMPPNHGQEILNRTEARCREAAKKALAELQGK